MRALLSIASLLASAAAHAHDGHGLSGGHWHATDTGGWVALAVVMALGLWLSRK